MNISEQEFTFKFEQCSNRQELDGRRNSPPEDQQQRKRILNIYFPFKSLGKISILSPHLNARLSSFIRNRLRPVSPLQHVFIYLSIRQTVPCWTHEPVLPWRPADDIGPFISIGLKGHRLVVQTHGRGAQAEVDVRRRLLSLQFYYCLSEWGRTFLIRKSFFFFFGWPARRSHRKRKQSCD